MMVVTKTEGRMFLQ